MSFKSTGISQEETAAEKKRRKKLNSACFSKMTPRCTVCSEDNVEAGHEQSKRHLTNVLLEELAKKKKHLAENRNGIVVSATARPTAYNAEPLFVDREQSLLKVSVKPYEGVSFTFTVKNDNEDVSIHFRGISTLSSTHFNFSLQNENISYGSVNQLILPQTCLEEQICVTFENNIVGVYKQPLYFIFDNSASGEPTVILKEMLVFVETVKRTHEKVDSPYALQPVKADRVKYTTARKKGEDDVFKLEKDMKRMFARGLNTKSDEITDEQRALAEKTKAILDAGPVEYNYIHFFHNLLWYEETVIGSNLKNYNMSGVKLARQSISGKSYSLLVPGLAEKRPSLMLGDLVFVKPHNQTEVMFEAIITDIQNEYAQFGGLDPGFKVHYKSDAKFDVRFFMSRMPQERMHVAVDAVRREFMTHKIFPKGNERLPTVKPIAAAKFYNQLVADNPEQRAVVEHIVAGSSGTAPYLLYGPPGTGKTVTMVEAILQLVKDPTNRILVCTDSNMAADHITTLLIKYVDQFPQKEFILRANSEFRVWEPMPKIIAPYSNGTKRSNYASVSIAKFMSYSIVVTTLIHAAKFAREQKQKKHQRVTTHVFIDEAAQASEPASLVPLCGLLAPGGALVLAGDPRQLGPVVISREADKLGLGVSLMERLKRDCPLYSEETMDPNYMVMLKKNFRSHPDILSIPSELFYRGQLEARAAPDSISNVDILGERPTSRAIVFYGVQSQEQRIGKSPSFYNSAELEVVQAHITALLDVHKVAQSDIGVVTPYIRQVYKMKKWLREKELTDIEVGTVEGFQGKEKRVIIVSTVRANCDLFAHDAKFRLGFLVDAKRFNVALTRAKAKLIVVGNPGCLQKDAKWRRYMAKCREFGTYCGHEATARLDEAQEGALDEITQILQLTRAMENVRV